METKVNHIPGPWAVKWNEATNRASIRKESDKRAICTIIPNDWDASNAQFIVKACNSHYELLEVIHLVIKESEGLKFSTLQKLINAVKKASE